MHFDQKEEAGYTIYVPKGPHIDMAIFKLEFLEHFLIFIHQAASQLMQQITTNFTTKQQIASIIIKKKKKKHNL